jgi:hypothetical protein
MVHSGVWPRSIVVHRDYSFYVKGDVGDQTIMVHRDDSFYVKGDVGPNNFLIDARDKTSLIPYAKEMFCFQYRRMGG